MQAACVEDKTAPVEGMVDGNSSAAEVQLQQTSVADRHAMVRVYMAMKRKAIYMMIRKSLYMVVKPPKTRPCFCFVP